MTRGTVSVTDDEYCFVCGRNNPIGLKLSFDLNFMEQSVTTVFKPSRVHQGWAGRLHGGLLVAILDEVMVNAAYLMDQRAVTGQMDVRFRTPVGTDEPLTATGRLVETRAKFLKASAECRNEKSEVVASATGLLIRVDG